MKNLNYLKFIGYCFILCVFTVMSAWVGTVQAEVYFGDPFEGGELQNPNWKWQNEPSEWNVGTTRADYLYINGEHNRNVWASDNSHLLYQETDVDMFDVETHFFAKWNTNSGVNGLIVKSPSDNNWVTLKFWSRDANAMGQVQYQTRQAGLTGDPSWRPVYGETELFFRLRKEMNTYSAWYKTEEDVDWIEVGVRDFTLTPPLWLGIYAGIAAGSGNLEVEYEYFKDNLNVTDVKPEGKAATTWGKVKSRY